MLSGASQLGEEVTAHAQSDSLEDAREICADSIYFPNNLYILLLLDVLTVHCLPNLPSTLQLQCFQRLD